MTFRRTASKNTRFGKLLIRRPSNRRLSSETRRKMLALGNLSIRRENSCRFDHFSCQINDFPTKTQKSSTDHRFDEKLSIQQEKSSIRQVSGTAEQEGAQHLFSTPNRHRTTCFLQGFRIAPLILTPFRRLTTFLIRKSSIRQLFPSNRQLSDAKCFPTHFIGKSIPQKWSSIRQLFPSNRQLSDAKCFPTHFSGESSIRQEMSSIRQLFLSNRQFSRTYCFLTRFAGESSIR